MKKQWRELKNHVLGQKFDLSVVFAEDKLMKELNSKYRKKNKSTDVLSFPLSESMGEIFLNKNLTETKSKDFIDFLFAHSLLHLKGYSHGNKMEEEEDKLTKKFGIKV